MHTCPVHLIACMCVSCVRSNDNHQAVSKDANTHKQVRQRESELEQSDCSLVVVVTIKQKGVLAVSLLV